MPSEKTEITEEREKIRKRENGKTGK